MKYANSDEELTLEGPDRRFSVLPLAFWFGLASGLLELALLVVRVKVFEGGAFLRSGHFVWMVPVSDVCLFLSVGLAIGWLARAWSGWGPRLVVGVFVFQACLGQLLLVRGLLAPACVLLAAGCSRVATPRLFAVWPSFQRWVRRSGPVLGVGLAALVVSAFGAEWLYRQRALEGRPPARPGAMNVLLVVLDTVRADHLSLYHYARETTPHLARLARGGVLFERAHSTAPWTLPSHASLMTGRWPHELDVEHRGGLDATTPTLAEFLRGRGYGTVGVVANQFYCGHESGLGRGFDAYLDYPVSPGEVLRSSTLGWLVSRYATLARDVLVAQLWGTGRDALRPDFQRKEASQVNREFLDWLAHHGDRPFFAFLNYFDAHDPYLVPEGSPRHLGRVPKTRDEARLLRDWWRVSGSPHSSGDMELLRDAYDDCIASLDQELGQLFGELARRGVLERTVVIVTADHGEEFGEHGRFRHGYSLYEPEVHVPLLIVAPSLVPEGRVVHDPVSLRDIPATVVDLLGDPQSPLFPGRSLARTWRPSGSPPAGADLPLAELRPLVEPTFARLDSPGSATALFDKNFAYIHHEIGPDELYDLDVDPTQSHDLHDHPDSAPVLARFRRTIKSLDPSHTDTTPN